MTPQQATAFLAANQSDASRPYALTVTDVAMHLTRQRGTHCSHPAFIAAYLATELAKEPQP